MNGFDCRGRTVGPREAALSVAVMGLVAGVMPAVAEARPVRGPTARIERRMARALAEPVPPPGRPAARARQVERAAERAAVPVPAASKPAAAAPVPAAPAAAQRNVQPQQSVKPATLEEAVPTTGNRGEDGMFSVLVRPADPAAAGVPEPLTFPADPRPLKPAAEPPAAGR